MIVAVVGAGGFLGSFLVRHLAAAGHEVLPVLRSMAMPQRPLDLLVDCNGDSRRFWANEHPADSLRANVLTVADRVLVPVGCYVLASSIDVYGPRCADRAANGEDRALDPYLLDTYGFHKLLAEQLVRFHAGRHLILRLGTLIGPGLKKNPVFDAVNARPIRQTRNSTLSLIDLGTVARALDCLLAAGAEGTFNVTGKRSVTVADVLAAVTARLGPRRFVDHAGRIHTDYDIDVSKASRHVVLPASRDMLEAYLAALAGTP